MQQKKDFKTHQEHKHIHHSDVLHQIYDTSTKKTHKHIHQKHPDPLTYFQLIIQTLIASGPIIGGLIIGFLIQTITFHYLGQLNNELVISSVGISYSYLNVIGGYLLLGMNQAFGSFAGRAFGAQNNSLLYNYFYKGLLILLANFTLITILITQSDKILYLLGQSQNVSLKANYFLLNTLPAIFSQFMFDFLKNYGNSQNIYNPQIIIQCLSILINYLTSKYFILQYGLLGAIYSINITYIFMLFSLIIYFQILNIMPKLTTFKSIKLNLFTYFKEVFSMGLPNFIDGLTFEINSFLIGTLHNLPQFAAHLSCANIIGLIYSFPVGIGLALNYIQSNAIGKNDYKTAHRCQKLCLILQVIQVVFYITIMSIFMNQIAAFYSSNIIVQNIIKKIMHLYFIAQLGDYIIASYGVLLKGIGKAKLMVAFFLLSYNLIGLPTSIYLGFSKNLGVFGFWIGFIIATYCCAFLLIITYFNINWESVVSSLYHQLKKDELNLQEQQEVNTTIQSIDNIDISTNEIKQQTIISIQQ